MENVKSLPLMEKSVCGILSVKIWFNQTLMPNKPHNFECYIECQNLVNSNLHVCHIILHIWVEFWVSRFGNLKFAWTCKYDSINRVIKVHGKSSWKNLEKTITNNLFTYTKALPSLVTHQIPQSRSKAGE